jgi:hypothetical protein
LIKSRHFRAGLFSLVRLREVVSAIFEKRTGRRVQRDRNILTRLIAGTDNSFDNELASLFVAFQVGRKSPFIADRSDIATALEDFL